MKASKRRRASPAFDPRAKFPGPRSPSMSPPLHEPGIHRSALLCAGVASLFMFTSFKCQDHVIFHHQAMASSAASKLHSCQMPIPCLSLHVQQSSAVTTIHCTGRLYRHTCTLALCIPGHHLAGVLHPGSPHLSAPRLVGPVDTVCAGAPPQNCQPPPPATPPSRRRSMSLSQHPSLSLQVRLNT